MTWGRRHCLPDAYLKVSVITCLQKTMIGILVCGDNHFILDGPEPDHATALELARHWTFIQIGRTTPPALRNWSIVTRAFRENLEWAVIVPGEGERTPAVSQLLQGLFERGITIRDG